MITLNVDPTKTVNWNDFVTKTTYPAYSIALDGFVNCGPKFDSQGLKVNFNHHEEVDRLATRSTCAQVLLAIRQGLFKTFTSANVFVNDCDEDVCLSWFLLKYHYLVIGAMNPIINRLVSMEDMLDSTAGAYPYPADMPVLQELAWIFEPYRSFRLSGRLDRRNAEEFKSIIMDVENRIMKHITGSGEKIAIDTTYEIIGGGNGWSMVKEIGSHARTGMFSDGISAYVSVRNRNDSTYTYTIGRLSPFIPFDIPKIIHALNEVENNSNDKWGGGNTIGGSPRNDGSKLSPLEVEKIINSIPIRNLYPMFC